MKILISEKISQNRYKTPEGFLVCLNCVLARTGKQTYTKSEVFGGDDETEIEIDRTAKEVFSPETLASFENKPLTIQHPDEDVNVDNYAEYAKGFIRNIRKGTVDGQEVMIGDIVVTDKEAIEKIENGELLDLSCGYDCDIQDEEHPQQRNIRGNHVALCEQGRAGCARIADSIKDGTAFGIVAHGVNDFYFTQNGQWAASTTNLKRYATRAEAERDLPKARHAKFDYNDKIEYISVEEFNTWDSIKDDLIESASEEAFKKNIATEIKAGKPIEQAVAIAYSIQRKHQQDNQEEAEKVVQKANEDFEEYMTDAMETYKIHWIDTYAKSKGYSRDMWSYDFEIKANSVREALQKLADKVALGGTGTANALIVSIHSDTASYMYSGKLSELLRTVADAVKDSRKTYEVKSKDEKGNTIVRYVKANSFIDAVKQKDATENDISKLTSAFQMAKQAANLHRNDKDGGASNFDTAIIFLDNFNINQVKKAAANAGLMADKYRGHSYFIYGYQEGQGFKYTNMAKAFAESLKQQGYDASVYYRID